MSTGVQRESAEPDNSTVTAKVNCWDQMREPLGELTASRSHLITTASRSHLITTASRSHLITTASRQHIKYDCFALIKRALASARWTEPAPAIPVMRIAKPLQPYHFIETGQRSMRQRSGY